METWNAAVSSLLYKPLSGGLAFRLLHLHPGTPDEDLHAELIPTTIDDVAEQYEATSYTWGSPDNPQRMTCNGISLVIQKNAFDMLKTLRKPDQPRTVWIDAICIDQSNIKERASQVSIMNHIYQRAKRVLVWLGNPDAYSTLAMAYAAGLDVFDLCKDNIGNPDISMADIYARKPYFFDAENETCQDEALGIALVKFVNRPWFSRVWVQQEAALCRETIMICGEQEVSWGHVFAVAWILVPRNIGLYPDYITDDLDRTLNNLTAIESIHRQRQNRFGFMVNDLASRGVGLVPLLVTTLVLATRLGATDPRDKLYSTKYLTVDADTWFAVDYSVPWQVLYADVARRWLQHGTLGFLKIAGRVRHKSGEILPSWAPDLRDGRWGSHVIVDHPRWMAGGPTPDSSAKHAGSVHSLPKHHRRRLDLPDELRNFKDKRKALLQSYACFKCIMYDEIIYLGGVLDDLFDNPAMLSIFQKDLDYIKGLGFQEYFNKDSLSDAYKLTLILSRNRKDEIVDSSYVRDNWDDWIRWVQDPMAERTNMPVWQYSMEASTVLGHCRFAITKHGYFCLVPRDTTLHDAVSIFIGHPLAMVIRPWNPPSTRTDGGKVREESSNRTGEEGYFELIGEAYIHGMMDNQARCIMDEFSIKRNPTESKMDAIMKASDSGHGVPWKTLGLHGGYERIIKTLGEYLVKIV
ncbi:heterokaryon incompatibility protein-domain-containing protein [Hypoxylon fragiforme]|uniref:heterokaryon incompatibility protein-domain-containing protein n=1 Tax=Hypoxylon fragiforme TaxID=63214 RepID=UPI0020C70ED1|nr:heterokaryon incompatibility protein-domain-containing protein [Hypoxylon fragiforme]KAI2608974.1 heterokaryon incompatibility protein-domain-containing protein [Hypoxylon fragiforme]